MKIDKQDLMDIGINPGPLFRQIFRATKSCKTKDEALSIAIAIRDGTFEKKKGNANEIAINSVLAWAIDNRHWFPTLEQTTGVENSVSAIRRMFEQRTITLNGRKPESTDMMEFPIWELIFFKGSKRQHTIFLNLDIAPVGSKWMTFRRERQHNPHGGDDIWKIIGEEWHEKG